MIEKKALEEEEQKNMVRISQELIQINGKYIYKRITTDLGLKKEIDKYEGVASDADSETGKYDMKLDKETFNFFRNEMS